MRIFFVSEAKAYHTQRWTKGLAQAGCEVHLISAYQADIPGVVLHRLPIYAQNPLKQVTNIARVMRLIRKLQPDIVHLFGLFSISSLGSMLIARNAKNLLISVWGSDVVPADRNENFKERLIKKYLLNKGNRLIATSHYLAGETKRYMKRPRQINVIPWGVDLEAFSFTERNRKENRTTVGFAKRLHKLAGPDILLEAFHYARNKYKKKIVLKVAGDGPMASELKKQAIQLGIADCVEWVGWLKADKEVSDFYGTLDLFVMPSRREAFGLSAVEASATGLPVIASRFGGIPEIVIHEETGLLVEPEDVEGLGEAIVTLAENRAVALSMGTNGRKRVEALFDWNSSVNQMIRIYQEVKRVQ